MDEKEKNKSYIAHMFLICSKIQTFFFYSALSSESVQSILHNPGDKQTNPTVAADESSLLAVANRFTVFHMLGNLMQMFLICQQTFSP